MCANVSILFAMMPNTTSNVAYSRMSKSNWMGILEENQLLCDVFYRFERFERFLQSEPHGSNKKQISFSQFTLDIQFGWVRWKAFHTVCSQNSTTFYLILTHFQIDVDTCTHTHARLRFSFVSFAPLSFRLVHLFQW